MLTLHPFIRLAVAFAIGVSVFLVGSPLQALPLYSFVAVGLVAADAIRQHLRFLIASLPLLAALLFLWGYVVPASGGHIQTGIGVATLFWLRICVLGGAFQWLLLPLTESPLHLRAFLAQLRLPTWATTLLVTPIVFLPEIRRRIERVVEARKAQALPATGLRGLRALPEIISPLVASLLEGALGRAELWAHRNLLAISSQDRHKIEYSATLGATVSLSTPLVIGLALWI